MPESTNRSCVKPLTIADLVDVVAAGFRDFRAAPRFGIAFASLYAGAGWLLVALLYVFGMPYLAYPLAMGFALVAPFAVVGLYAVSDRLQKNEPLSWRTVTGAVRDAARRDLRWMALITGFALVIWMDIAAFLLFAFVGVQGFGSDFLETILTTPTGLAFLLIGNVAGAMIAVGVFSISAVSFPMLYDRDVDFITAMTTSIRLVLASPKPMLAWCAIIGLSVGLSLASMLLGLFVALPVIGHATWHLYRRSVEPPP